MRITFQTADTNQNVDRRKTAERESSVQRIGTGNGYALDISDTVMDNGIYTGHGKTTEEIMQEAGGQNVALTHNYMAVMSNSMSDEDFAELQKNGYQTGDVDVETAVTIVDQIKASLLQAGVSITGYTDTLDTDTLTEITGNAALAEEMSRAFSEKGVPLTEETAKAAMQALEEAGSLAQPGDDTMKYMVVNEKEPVLQDLYMARYSSLEGGSRQGRGYYQDENGYLYKKADSINWESLQPQMDKVIEEAGLEEIPGAEDAAKWLIESGIPLTKEALASYMELQKIALPMETKELLSAMADAVSDGKSPKEANLTGARPIWEQAAGIWRRMQEITPEAADLAADQGKRLTFRNLDAMQKLIDSGYQNIAGENVTARRQLEEVRLQMTVSANRELIKSGYAIETAELEALVEALKNVENEQKKLLFGGDEIEDTTARAELYEEAIRTVAGIPQMPAAVVGKVSIPEAEFTLDQVKAEGEALISAYQKAGDRYETFQTMPRRDMGDSIAKAFRNAEVLLDELQLEATDANKRAVRILGYNSLEITEENIQIVKEADQALRNVVKKMTPAATLQMIREGKNPLTMTVAELDDYLSGRQQGEEEEQEKYSKFLYKLEQKKEITEEEKESYIGIYRLIRQIEKSDGAVIGSLIHQGAELSFKNLLTAVRTSRAKRMDAVVDDDLGTLQEVKEKGVSIDDQVGKAFTAGKKEGEAGYYKRLNHEIYENLDGDRVSRIGPEDSMDLETFAEKLRLTETDEELEAAYRRTQTEQWRGVQQAEGKLVELLQLLEEPVTLNNVRAIRDFRKDSSGTFTKIKKEADKRSREDFEKGISDLEECFNSKEEAAESYHKLVRTEKQILEDAMFETEGTASLDVRELGLVYKQVSFTAKMADTQRFEIPIITEDSCMALHLQIIHSGKEKGMVEASMETERYGKISISLQVQGRSVRGFFIGSEQGSREQIEALREQIEERLSRTGLETGSMNIGFRKDLQTGFSFEREATPPEQNGNEIEQTSTRTLYQAAKAVIITVRKQAERG